jgi:hypothetical protein
VKTAAQAAQNWVNSAGVAATNYQAGVNAYTGDWAGVTVAAYPNWVSGLATAQAQGSWQAGVNAAGTNGWKSATIAKTANYSTGFTAGAAEQSQAIGKIMNALGGIVPALPPRGSYSQNKARANALMDALHALKGTLGAAG